MLLKNYSGNFFRLIIPAKRSLKFSMHLKKEIEFKCRDNQYELHNVFRCRKNETAIKQLKRELEEATVDKEEEVSKRNEVIRKLKLDIHSIEKSADDHINRTKVIPNS